MRRPRVLTAVVALALAGCAPLPDPADGCGRVATCESPATPATGCTALDPDPAGGTYQAGHAGTVEVYREGDGLTLVQLRPARGWADDGVAETVTAMTVRFTRADELVEFHARVTEEDLLETEYCYTRG